MSSLADEANSTLKDSNGTSSNDGGKQAVSRSKLPPPPMVPPPQPQEKCELQEKESSAANDDAATSKASKPHIPKKPQISPDKTASPKLTSSDKTSKSSSLKGKKNKPKPSLPAGKPKLSDLKQKSSFDEKARLEKHVTKRTINEDDVALQQSSLLAESRIETRNGNIGSDANLLHVSSPLGNVDKARQSFNLKVALSRAAEKKTSDDRRLTPPRKFVPSKLPKRSSQSFSVSSDSAPISSSKYAYSFEETTASITDETTKSSPSPSFSDKIKFWVKNPNKTPPSPTSACASEIQSKKSKKNYKNGRQRKASAKFYTDMGLDETEDHGDRISQISATSNSSSTFYVSDSLQESKQPETFQSSRKSEDHCNIQDNTSKVSDGIGKTNENINSNVEKEDRTDTSEDSNELKQPESHSQNVAKKQKPTPPPKKPMLLRSKGAASDSVFSDSPPLPRKTISNLSAAIRNSMILPSAEASPVAPVRKNKKLRRPGPLQLTMDSSRDSSVEREGSVSPMKRINSTSFTTDDFDIFQRSKSKDYDMEDKASKPSQQEETVSTNKSLRRPGSGRVRDKEKRRSKSVGAPGFNMFGVKLKPVMSPTAEKSEGNSPSGRVENTMPTKGPSWLHAHLSPEVLQKNMEVASGFYDNNFTVSHPADSQDNTPGQNEPSWREAVYEDVDDDSVIQSGTEQVQTATGGTSELVSGGVENHTHLHQDRNPQETGAKNDRFVSDNVTCPTGLTITVDSPKKVEHEYADIGSPTMFSMAKCKSIENLYNDICDNITDSTNVSDVPDKPVGQSKSKPPLLTGHKLIDLEKSNYASRDNENALQVRLERKLSRKLSRKASRKWSRKLTKKFRENKYARLQQLLSVGADSDEELEGELEELSFSETDSEFDDDSFTDDSDMEFEQELLSKLAEDGNSELAEIYAAANNITPMSKVQRIANEVLTTERSYVEKLELLDQKFHFTILIENRSHKMFPDEVIPQMFSNIKSIYQFHHDFLLPQLEKRMKDWEETPKIGDVMKKFAPFLKLYTEYVQNFDNANAAITSWMEKSPKFAAVLSEIQRLPECGHLSLQHHMLSPIQRVPRYELLLKDYLKNLTEENEDTDDTKKALEIVTRAAQHSNEVMRKNAKFRNLLDLNQALGSTINLVSPTRELIKEGKITKIAARNGLSQERYIFLFNDKLLLCQSVPVTLGTKQQYKVKLLMDIDGMQVLEGDNLETPNTFYVKSKQRILELHTDTGDEKVEWQMTLWNVITEFTKKMQSRGEMKDLRLTFLENDEDLGKRAPKWIKDQETSQCMQCATPFTIIKRRHHCRACGKVVCGRCSNFEVRLAYDNNKSRRVCADCFAKLDKSPGTTISSPTLSQPVARRKGILNVKASDPSVITGYLHMTQDKKNWQKRFFAIHHDFVLFSFKAHQDVRALTSMPLPGYVVQEVEETDVIDRSHTFKVSHKSPTGQKTYFFQADDKESKEKWVHTLQHVVMAEMPPGFLATERSTSVLSDGLLKQEVNC